MPAKIPWRTWINNPHKSNKNYDVTTAKQTHLHIWWDITIAKQTHLHIWWDITTAKQTHLHIWWDITTTKQTHLHIWWDITTTKQTHLHIWWDITTTNQLICIFDRMYCTPSVSRHNSYWCPRGPSLSQTAIMAWIINHPHCFVWVVITNPCSNFNSGLAKPMLKLRQGWVITSHTKKQFNPSRAGTELTWFN